MRFTTRAFIFGFVFFSLLRSPLAKEDTEDADDFLEAFQEYLLTKDNLLSLHSLSLRDFLADRLAESSASLHNEILFRLFRIYSDEPESRSRITDFLESLHHRLEDELRAQSEKSIVLNMVGDTVEFSLPFIFGVRLVSRSDKPYKQLLFALGLSGGAAGIKNAIEFSMGEKINPRYLRQALDTKLLCQYHHLLQSPHPRKDQILNELYRMKRESPILYNARTSEILELAITDSVWPWDELLSMNPPCERVSLEYLEMRLLEQRVK